MATLKLTSQMGDNLDTNTVPTSDVQLPKGALDLSAIDDTDTDADMAPDVGGGAVPVQTPNDQQSDNTVFGVQQADIQARRQAIQDAIDRIQARQQQPTDIETQPLALYSILGNQNPWADMTPTIMGQDKMLSDIKQARLDKSDDANLQGALAQNQFLGQDQENNLKAQQIAAMALWRQAQATAATMRANAYANGGVNGARTPAAIAIANEIQKAQEAGDTQRADLLRQSAKMGSGWSPPAPVVAQTPDSSNAPAPAPSIPITTTDNSGVTFPMTTPPTSMVINTDQGIALPANNTPNANPQLTGDDFLATLPADKAASVKLVGDGNEKSSTFLSRMPAQDKIGFMAAVAQYNPNYNANTFGSVQQFNTGKLGNTVRSLGVANQHLQVLSGLSDALDNGNVQLFNTIGNKYATATGNAAPTNFDTAKQTVADEITKAIIGAGGTGADRDKAAQVIQSANSPAQLKGAIATYQQLMQGQLSGLQQQYERSTGRKDFNTLLPPSMQQQVANPAFTIPQGAVQIGTKGGKAVYKLPDGSGLMEP